MTTNSVFPHLFFCPYPVLFMSSLQLLHVFFCLLLTSLTVLLLHPQQDVNQSKCKNALNYLQSILFTDLKVFPLKRTQRDKIQS